MSKKINRKALVAIVAVIAVIAVVGSSLAWFVTQTSKSQRFLLSGIKASAVVSFANGKNAVDSEKYKDSNGLYVLSLNENDENYIGKLRVTVNHSGSSCCLRVKMAYEWQFSDGSVSQYSSAVPFVFGSDWYDNRNTDYCIYYRGDDDSGKFSADSMLLISGFNNNKFDTSGFEDGVTVKVLIEVDAVQFNRYPQLWNIEKLPWE